MSPFLFEGRKRVSWRNTITAPNSTVIAWAITAACFVCGLACIYFAHKERAVHRAKANAIVLQMKLIEERFEREEI